MAAVKSPSGTFQAQNFRSKVDVFTTELEKNRARARHLGLEEDLTSDDPVQLREAVEQLRLQHEELEVAEEELRAQLEELGKSSLRLEAERERYRALFDFAHDALFVTDLHGAIREANIAAGELTNFDSHYLKGKPLAAFIERDLKFDFRTALSRAADGETVELEARIEGRRGRQVRVTLRGARAYDPKRLLWSARPLEALVRSASAEHSEPPPSGDAYDEPEASRRERELEGQLEEKVHLLDRAKETQRELEEANQVKDRSLAIISHELRAPMQAILGWTHMLRTQSLEPSLHERGLTIIERNCRTQAELIENLFDLSRMVAKKLHVDREALDLGSVVALVTDTMLGAARQQKVELVSEIEEDIWILGDQARLQQIITNLIVNALRHSSEGTQIKVTLRANVDVAEIVVADQGEGIEPAMLERIFDCFEQGVSGYKKGLGLGLFLVRGLVHMHEGWVRAESAGRGKGARFIVAIPLCEPFPA